MKSQDRSLLGDSCNNEIHRIPDSLLLAVLALRPPFCKFKVGSQGSGKLVF